MIRLAILQLYIEKMNKPNLNVNQNDLEQLIVDCIQGESKDHSKARLIDLAQDFQKNPYDLFSGSNYSLDNPEGLNNILATIATTPEQQNALINAFFERCNRLNISTNLINFLEFMASQGFHRLHPYIQLINQTDVHGYSFLQYILGSLVATATAGMIAFLYNQQLLHDLEVWFTKNSEYFLKLSLKYILIAENLAFISLLFKLVRLMYQFYALINNHATNEENKFNKLLKLILSNALIISAQVLTYINHGVMAPAAGYLIITASFLDLCWSISNLIQLEKPIRPDESLKTENPELYKKQMAHFYEETAFYNRKLKIFYHEIWAFTLIAAATIVSIMFAQNFLILNLLCIVLQLLVTVLKDYLISRSQHAINENLQRDIKGLYKTEGFFAAPASSKSTQQFTPSMVA